jgi:hypothetical protein
MVLGKKGALPAMAYTVHSVATYGSASKWSMEAVKSRGTSGSSASASANDIFFGPTQTGTDWGAAILTATSTDDAMADYVKRNYEKFSGGTLEAMLTSTNLVDWYKSEMQKKIADGQKQLADAQDSLNQTTSQMFETSRVQSILSSLAASKPSQADGGDTIAAPDTSSGATSTTTDGTSTASTGGTSTTDGTTTSADGASATSADSSNSAGGVNLLV